MHSYTEHSFQSNWKPFLRSPTVRSLILEGSIVRREASVLFADWINREQPSIVQYLRWDSPPWGPQEAFSSRTGIFRNHVESSRGITQWIEAKPQEGYQCMSESYKDIRDIIGPVEEEALLPLNWFYKPLREKSSSQSVEVFPFPNVVLWMFWEPIEKWREAVSLNSSPRWPFPLHTPHRLPCPICAVSNQTPCGPRLGKAQSHRSLIFAWKRPFSSVLAPSLPSELCPFFFLH